MNTNYKSHIASPFQVMQKKAEVQERKNPSFEEVERNIGTFTLTIDVEEDKEMLAQFKHISGYIAYKCTIRMGNQLLSIGKGSAILSRFNKVIERSSRYAYTSSIIDGIVHATKMLDALYLQSTQQNGFTPTFGEVEKATEAQKSYLQKLIASNITDRTERSRWESELDKLSKEECSEKIQYFVNNY